MKKFRHIAIAILAALALVSVCAAVAACDTNGHENNCTHPNCEWVPLNEFLHQQICADCGDIVNEEPHSFDTNNVELLRKCTLCGYTENIEPIDPGDEDEYGGLYEYQLSSEDADGVCGIRLQVNLHYARKNVTEIPSEAPEKECENLERWASERGAEFANEVRRLEFGNYDYDYYKPTKEMFTSLAIPESVEEIYVYLDSTDTLEANGQTMSEFQWFKSLCKHEDGGYYLGTANNAYHAFICADKVEELTVHAGTKIFLNNALRDGSYEPEAAYTLKKITLPEGIKSLPEGGFYRMYQLREVNIPDGVTYIPAHCFEETEVSELTIPDSVVEIGDEAFRFAPLHTLVLPDSVTKLGKKLFVPSDDYGHAMRYLELGSGITELPEGTFTPNVEILELCNRSQLTLTNDAEDDTGTYINAHHIITDPAETSIFTEGEYVYYRNGYDVLCIDYIGEETALTLPEMYGQVSYSATPLFGGFSNVTELTIPTTVHSWSLNHPCRYGANTQICVPEKITGSWQLIQDFQNDKLEYLYDDHVYRDTREIVVLGNIRIQSTHRSEFDKVTLDTSVKSVTPAPDETSHYSNLLTATDLYVMPGALADCDTAVLGRLFARNSLKADCRIVAHIVADGGYDQVIERVEITSYDPNTYTTPASTYSTCGIRELVVSEGITTLPDYLFGSNDYVWLEKVTLPQSFRVIPDRLLLGGDFEEIELPEGITKIGNDAFRDCENLKTLTVPAGVEHIGAYAFLDCNALTSIVMPDALSFLGWQAFNSETIGDRVGGVIYLGKYAIGFDGTIDDVVLRDNTEKLFDFGYAPGNPRYNIDPTITSIELPASLDCWASLVWAEDNFGLDGNGKSVTYADLKEIRVDDANEHFASCTGLLYNKAQTELLCVPYCFDPEQVHFPETLTHIGEDLFNNTAAFWQRPTRELWELDGWVLYLSLDSGVPEVDPTKRYADGILDNIDKFSWQGFIYNQTDGKLTLNSVTDKDLYFVNIYPGTYAVASNAFADMPNLYGVYFPASVQKLNSALFGNCTHAVNRYFEGDLPKDSRNYAMSTGGTLIYGVVDGGEYTHVTIDPITSNIYVDVENTYNRSSGAETLYMICGNTSMPMRPSTVVKVPDMHDDKVVDGVADYAFMGSPIYWLDVSAEDTHVKFIGKYAFQGSRLGELHVTNVGYIGEHAFDKTQLSSVGNCITFAYNDELSNEFALWVEDKAFANNEFSEIQFGTTNVVFGRAVFEGCQSLLAVGTGETDTTISRTWYTATVDMSGGQPSVVVTEVQLTALQLAQALKSNNMPYAYLRLYIDVSAGQ